MKIREKKAAVFVHITHIINFYYSTRSMRLKNVKLITIADFNFETIFTGYCQFSS